MIYVSWTVQGLSGTFFYRPGGCSHDLASQVCASSKSGGSSLEVAHGIFHGILCRSVLLGIQALVLNGMWLGRPFGQSSEESDLLVSVGPGKQLPSGRSEGLCGLRLRMGREMTRLMFLPLTIADATNRAMNLTWLLDFNLACCFPPGASCYLRSHHVQPKALSGFQAFGIDRAAILAPSGEQCEASLQGPGVACIVCRLRLPDPAGLFLLD